jgi:hypothetical protein
LERALFVVAIYLLTYLLRDGVLHVAQAGLELKFSFLSLQTAEISGVHHHTQLERAGFSLEKLFYAYRMHLLKIFRHSMLSEHVWEEKSKFSREGSG